jgi:uncharacterized protein
LGAVTYTAPKFLVSEDLTNGSLEVAPEIAEAISNDYLNLIVNPTERCNLRCIYCYETFVLKKMEPKLISGILNLVKRRAERGLKTFKLDFFGGEPLAAWDVVEKLARELSAICRTNGTEMFGGITTNGVLLDRSRVDLLAAHNVRAFQVTLDGPQAIHDKRRITRDGSGTFRQVWRALEILKACPHRLNVLIRMHFDPSTLEQHFGDDGFVGRVARNFARGDVRFRLHFHAVGRWGGPNDKDIPVFRSPVDEKAAIGRLTAEALAAGCSAEQVAQCDHDAPVGESGHTICYAARANSFVIRSDGRVAKCTVAFEDDRNTVGKLTESGDLVIDQSRHLPWLHGLITGDPLALTCPAIVYLWGKEDGSTKAA